MAPFSRFAFLALAILLAACDHQYLAIPGARQVAEDVPQHFVSTQQPTVTVVNGSPALVVGTSVRLKVDFSPVTDLPVTQILFMAKGTYGNWALELTPEEVAAGSVEVEVHALSEEPDDEWCRRNQRGSGGCSQLADEGVTFFGISPANATSMSIGSAPLTLPPLQTGSSDSCASFTAQDCCAGSPGISAVACYVSTPCGCPLGTTESGGVRADGTTMCMCP